MAVIIHRSEERGSADHGWLQTHHSFSFASWYDPERTNFGALRVLNDDFVAPGKGFSTHPHNNMEIITIPLSGKLQHRDDMGNGSVISEGEIQIMSAGTGIRHSEFNPSDTEYCNLLQIWIFPAIRNIEPRYDQLKYDLSELQNKIRTLVTPDDSEKSLKIIQDAYLSLTKPEENHSITYTKKLPANGVYIFVIRGHIETNGHILQDRDAIGFTEEDVITLHAHTNAFLLVIEVPVNGFDRDES